MLTPLEKELLEALRVARRHAKYLTTVDSGEILLAIQHAEEKERES